ncbi:MAG: hypothetical protein O7G87_12625 [bacterium]|nr:hypothetical protein [bacterium]
MAVHQSRNGYGRALSWVMNHRRDTFLVVLVLFATIWYPMEQVKQTDRIRGTSNRVYIRYWGPTFFSLEEMGRIAEDVEQYMDERRDLYKISSVMTYCRRGYFNLRVSLRDNPNQEWWYVIYAWGREKLGFPTDRWLTRKAII